MSGNSVKIGAAALAAALIVGGVAWAGQDGSRNRGDLAGPGLAFGGSEAFAGKGRGEARHGHRGRGLLRKVARAELVMVIDGETRKVRLDRGTVKSVSASAITLEELDGTTVTIPVDDETVVRVGREKGLLDAVEEGFLAMTVRVDGGAARMVRAFDREQMPVRSRE